jgi:CRISPR/Cas system-associated protein Cas5 (RAMP superfamily)
MPKRPGSNPKQQYVFFDVVYEDGSQRSNRRVPADVLDSPDKDKAALGYLIEQDREIAERSGRPPLAIKSFGRTGSKLKPVHR